MANVITVLPGALPVPANAGGVSAAVDVRAAAGPLTFTLNGNDGDVIRVQGSPDGINLWGDVLVLSNGNASQTPAGAVFGYVRLVRDRVDPSPGVVLVVPQVSITAQPLPSGYAFITAAIPVPAGDGVGASVNLQAAGLTDEVQKGAAKSIVCSAFDPGDNLTLENSADGNAPWATMMQLQQGKILSLAGAIGFGRIRRARVPAAGPRVGVDGATAAFMGQAVAAAGGGSTDVKSFGAKGDGVTDDTAAIAAAVAALAGGGELVFPPGNYRNTSVAINNINGITVRGVGATLTCTVEVNSPLQFTNCNRVRVSGLNITQSTQLARNASSHGIGLINCTDAVVQGNTLSALTGAGIFSSGSSKISIRDNYVTNTLADGIHTTGACTDVVVQGNHCIATGDDAIAVVSYQADGATCKRVAIVGNTVFQSNTRGITVVGGEQCAVADNVVESTSGAGIYIAHELAIPTFGVINSSVTGNVVKDADTFGSVIASQASIVVAGSDAANPVKNIHIAANQIFGGGYRFVSVGTSVAGAIDAIFVTANKCYGPNVAAAGIEFDRIPTGGIVDNSIYFANTTGIFVDANSTTIIVSGNVVYYPNQAFAGFNGVDNRSTAGWTGLNIVQADPGKPLTADVAITNGSGGVMKTPHALAVSKASLLLTQIEGARLECVTPADAVNTVQNSPLQSFVGAAWNSTTPANNAVAFWIGNTPVSGATVSGALRFYVQIAGGALVEVGRMNSNGAWVVNSSLFLGNATDNTGNLGSVTQRPAQVWGMRHMLGQTTIAAASTTNINTSTAGGSVRLTLGTNVTSMTIAAGNAGEILTLELIQDSTGGRTMPASWTNVVFAGGAYAVTATLSKRDVLQFVYDATDAKWYERSRSVNL